MHVSIIKRIYLIVCVCTFLGLLPLLVFADWTWLQKGAMASVCVLLCILFTGYATRSINAGLQALDVGLQNFKDGEFSSQLAYENNDELGQLCQLYNQTAEQLRQEKHWIHQRELMLDKVLHSSPDVLFLVNDKDYIVFSNLASRHFFNAKSRLEGCLLNDLLAPLPESLKKAIIEGKTGLFSATFAQQENQTWHLTQGTFLLNNQKHTLYILKPMTRELNRQEVTVWKKVIRLISHELNNSLGPISSMLHSGQLVSQQIDDDRLERVFATIEERIKHLNQFVQGYGKFAKLPTPKCETIDWHKLVEQLKQQWKFTSTNTDDIDFEADPVQLEQLLINLLKNAHESGAKPDTVEVSLSATGQDVTIKVSDGGKGIPNHVMANALVPFYSTKKAGSGLGLALCREITEAHNGQISLQNRPQGGLTVSVTLPRQQEKDDVWST